MMDISRLANATNQITGLANLIVVAPQQTIGYQPQLSSQKPLLFHYEAENTINLESDITDHYTEDNSAINDHIALRPEQVTVRGFIGELNDVVPEELQVLKTASEKLVAIGSFVPQLSESALNAYNNAWYLYNVGKSAFNAAVSAYSTLDKGSQVSQPVVSANGISNGKTQNQQQLYFQQFYGYWHDRVLFTVQTPWAVFENMAIKNLRVLQDADTAVISDFEITFKMIRYAKTIRVADREGRLFSQGSSLLDLGTSTPSPATESLLGFVGKF
jgi:hypothetical protein